ncbi:MAG TPA: C-terminal binding protein [Chloroflexota bacterium]|nr:C-terminal binding protein [Chloroflexota bacterium]
MARFVVAITDNAFAPVEVERRLFGEIDAEVRFPERAALTEETVVDLAADADAILCDAAPITRRVLEACRRVRVASEYGIGYDNIDVAAATELGVWVTNVPGFCTEEVADHTLAMVLALARRLPALDRAVRAGRWGAGAAGPMRRLSSQTLGLIGFGRIGQTAARKASALGLRVLAHSPHTTPERARPHGAEAATLDEVLRRSDYLALVAPATPETRGLIDRAALAKMKPTAYLINCGRGALVDEAALVEALRSGRIAGAALDVHATEPPAPDSPLLGLENVLLTPHAAFYSQESLADLQLSAIRNAIAVLRGEPPATPVNPEVADRAR